MTRIISVEDPRRYSLRLSGETFEAVVDWATHNSRSVNGEFCTLIEEALQARAERTANEPYSASAPVMG